MTISTAILDRKGPRKLEDISPEVLQLLNRGEIETVNLTEWLGVNQPELIRHTFPSLGLGELADDLAHHLIALKKPTAMNMVQETGKVIAAYAYENSREKEIYNALIRHKSDTVRCYAPWIMSLDPKLTLKEKLDGAHDLVNDAHFGIREVIWMAFRPEFDRDLENAITFLNRWSTSEHENIRRFTTEATRPRGVWCKHIDRLKEEPALALPLLEPLRSDPSLYVQNSVANWLNDASKTQPQFVISLCDRWAKESTTKETAKIIKRARRTIDKK